MNGEEGEQTEMEMGEDFQILDATYDISDPANPRLISSRRGGKKPRSRNAQKQADLRARRAEEGLKQTQVFVPPEQKQALQSCVQRLAEGGNPIAELAKAQAESTRLAAELSAAQARLGRIPSWVRRIFGG